MQIYALRYSIYIWYVCIYQQHLFIDDPVPSGELCWLMATLVLCNREKEFSLIRQKTKIFPINPIIKIAHVCNVMSRHDVTKMGDFYNGGVWGNFSLFVGSNWTKVDDFYNGPLWGNFSFFYRTQLNCFSWLYKKTLTHIIKVSVWKNKK